MLLVLKSNDLRVFLNDIPLLPNPIPHISLHCDSQDAIAKINSKNYNEKKRHLIVRHKSIRHLISHGVIFVDFVNHKIILQIRSPRD